MLPPEQTSFHTESEKHQMALSLTRLRRSIVLLSVILVGALVLAAAPAAISADEDTRSIEQFQPITISEDSLFDLEAIAEDLDPITMLMVFMQIQDLGEIDSDLTEESFYEVDSLAEVDRHLAGSFLTPEYLPDGFDSSMQHFGVGDAGTITATFDVQVARSISRLLDLPTDWLPDPSEHDSMTITLDVPASGMAGWKSGFDMLIVGQIGLPELDVPEELDLELLRDAIIEDPRMPDELADQLGAIDNWDETMPVPVPEGAEYEDLTIDGNAGFMLTLDNEGGAVVWESNGVLHVVGGNLSSSELLSVAESME
jgi:hypothetical protein